MSAHKVEVYVTVGAGVDEPYRVGRVGATEQDLREVVVLLEESMLSTSPQIVRIETRTGWIVFPSTQVVDVQVVGVGDLTAWLQGVASPLKF